MTYMRLNRVHPVQASLGFITAWPTRDGWRSAENHRRFHFGARARARELGYDLEEFWLCEPGMTPRRMTNILRARGIQGLVLQSLPVSDGHLSLGWENFACVTKGLTLTQPLLHRVVSSHYEDMQLVIGHLIPRGYNRIGLVLGEALCHRVNNAWLAAFLVYQNTLAPFHRLPPLILREEPSFDLFARWIRESRPDVILFSDQPVQDWIRQLGMHVPEDIGFVNLNWSSSLAPMAGLDSEVEALGAAAIDLLVGQLGAHEFGIPRLEKIVTVKGRWVPGTTIRPEPVTERQMPARQST
jgi:LacI family transcriptional regulator